jgi:hypothetical protein
MDMRFDLLLKAFSSRYGFYVLGAGASAGVMPTTRQLGIGVVQPFIEFGLYPAISAMPDDVFLRVLNNIEKSIDPFHAILLKHIPIPAVHAITLQQLAPTESDKPIYQYLTFNLCCKPSVLFNLNVDGLAKRYCIGHIVLDPHGTVPSIVRTDVWGIVIEGTLGYDLQVPPIPGNVHLPKRESNDITARAAYQRASIYFPLARCLVLIGYSFGKFGNSIDDSETFAFLCELLRRYPKPVIVIGLDPEEIAAAIQEAAHLRPVYSISAFWNHLSQAMVEVAYRNKCYDPTRLYTLHSQICYRYIELCNSAV